MEKSEKYKTFWYSSDEDVEEGRTCDNCHSNGIRKSNYFEGFYCPDKTCGWKYKLTKYDKKEKSGMGGTERIVREQDQGEKILTTLAGLKQDLHTLNHNLLVLHTKFNKFLTKNGEIPIVGEKSLENE